MKKKKIDSIHLRISVIKGRDSGYRLASPNFDFKDGAFTGYVLTLSSSIRFRPFSIHSDVNWESTLSANKEDFVTIGLLNVIQKIPRAEPSRLDEVIIPDKFPTPSHSINILQSILDRLSSHLSVRYQVYLN